MKRELQHTLFLKYHVFFDWLKDDESKLIQPMQFGIECGDGWYWLLDNLMNSIYRYQSYNKHLKGNEEFIHVKQIKEKFGGLEFYFNGGNETIRGMVWLASNQSYTVCEYCGTTENVGRTAGWISVMCKPCYDKDTKLGYREWKPNDNKRLKKLARIKTLINEDKNKTTKR